MMYVAELRSLQHLPENLATRGLVKPVGALFQFIEHGMVHELEHQVQTLLPPEHFYQVDQMVMPELLKKKN